MSWQRYEGSALADVTLSGAALRAELEDYIRVRNSHLTDVRVEQVTATAEHDTRTQPPRRSYRVTYLADDGLGHAAKP